VGGTIIYDIQFHPCPVGTYVGTPARHCASWRGLTRKSPHHQTGVSLSHTGSYGLRRTRTETVPATLQTSALPLGYGAGDSKPNVRQ
jgi:hypothetical protein